MSDSFHVLAHRDARAEDEQGIAYLVAVREVGNPGLIAHLRVLRYEEDGVHLLRIVWAQLTSEDEDAAVHLTLDNGMWWHRALDAVLGHLIGEVVADDLTADAIRFGWVGGEVGVVEPRAIGGGGADSAAFRWAVRKAREWCGSEASATEPRGDSGTDPELTEEQLEAFFEEIAQMLAEKAFEAAEDEDDETASEDEASEGEDR